MNLNSDNVHNICEYLHVFDQTCLSSTCKLYFEQLNIEGNDLRWGKEIHKLIQNNPSLKEIVKSNLVSFNLYESPMYIKTLYQYHLYTFKIMNNLDIVYDCDYNLEMVDSFSDALIDGMSDIDVVNFKKTMKNKYNTKRNYSIDKNKYIEDLYSTPLKTIFKVRNKIQVRKQKSIDYKYNKPFIVIRMLINFMLQHTVYNPSNNNAYTRFSYNSLRDYLSQEYKIRGFKDMINEFGYMFIDEAHLVKTQQLEPVSLLIYSTGNNQNYSFNRIRSSRYRLQFIRAHSSEGGWCIWF